uniref:guanylate cyclase n=1 Tax=Eptatretus burgeri TaxID=7764 RepID=A0A8C4QIC4_EPTBU
MVRTDVFVAIAVTLVEIMAENKTNYLLSVVLMDDHKCNMPWTSNLLQPFIDLGIEHANRRLRAAGLKERINSSYHSFTPVNKSCSRQSHCQDTDCLARGLVNKLQKNSTLGCTILGPSCQYASYGLVRAYKYINRTIISAGSYGLSTSYMPSFVRTAINAMKVSDLLSVFWQLQNNHKPAWSTAYLISGNMFNSDICFWYLQALMQDFDNFISFSKRLQHKVEMFPSLQEFQKEMERRYCNVVIYCGDLNTTRDIMESAERAVGDDISQMVFVNVDMFGSYDQTRNEYHFVKSTLLVVTLPGLNASCPSLNESCDVSAEVQLPMSKLQAGFYETALLYGSFVQRNSPLKRINCQMSDTMLWKNSSYLGNGHMVYFDSNGDADGDIDILLLHDGQFHHIWTYDTRFGLLSNTSDIKFTLPSDKPASGPISSIVTSLVSVSVLMVLVIFGCILLWRKYKMEKQLCKQRWIIPWHLLRILPEEDNNSTHEVRRRNIDYNEKVIASSFLKFNLRKYDNKVVVLKPLEINEKEISKKQKMKLHEFTMLDVENLAKFYGTTSCSSIATTYAVFEYCNRGSLWDVLADRMTYPETSFVDWHWKVSTMNEIAKGMAYLHSTLNTLHGHLTSTNCVVDSSMVVKVTDFILAVEDDQAVYTKQQDSQDFFTCCHQTFRMWTTLEDCWRKRARVQQQSSNYTDFKPHSKLWIAPEHLHNDGASQKGDVYSFGIILQELLYRRGVFFIRDGSFSHDGGCTL